MLWKWGIFLVLTVPSHRAVNLYSRRFGFIWGVVPDDLLCQRLKKCKDEGHRDCYCKRWWWFVMRAQAWVWFFKSYLQTAEGARLKLALALAREYKQSRMLQCLCLQHVLATFLLLLLLLPCPSLNPPDSSLPYQTELFFLSFRCKHFIDERGYGKHK